MRRGGSWGRSLASPTYRWTTVALVAALLIVLLHTTALPSRLLSSGDDGGSPTVGFTAAPRSYAPRTAPIVLAPSLTNADVAQAQQAIDLRCGARPRSFQPLGTFRFWGKDTNESFPCPTAGFNNQLQMHVALFHCAMRSKLPDRAWRFKDITCSPTGGREGGVKFAVGGADYEYAWFRLSEVYDVARGIAAFAVASRGTPSNPPLVVCLNDSYTWKEHPTQMGRCETNIGHLYNTPEYWQARQVFAFKERYHTLGYCFVRWAAETRGAVDKASDYWDTCTLTATESLLVKHVSSAVATLGIHVRRGDYEHFCRGIVGNSGKSKFRTPPFLAFRRNSTSFAAGKQVMKACSPDDATIMHHVRNVAQALERQNGAGDAGIVVLAIATNAPSVVSMVRAELAKQASSRVVAVTLKEFIKAATIGRGLPRHWPPGLGGGNITMNDRGVLDVALLSKMDAVILNRYSTFSHSAVDERVMRRGMRAGAEPTLGGLQLHWW
jgi:hypothetical protein